MRPIVTLILIAVSAFPSTAQVSRFALWGDLQPGAYAVGFRVLYRYDNSRTWKPTRLRGQSFHADAQGRPVRIELWYPATLLKAAPGMKYGDYINLPFPDGFKEAATVLGNRDQLIASFSAPADKMEALLSTAVAAHKDAHAAPGRFPLIVYFPGLDDTQSLNVFVMAEYLASHGYVLATVSLLGQSSEEPDQHRTNMDIEATVRDAEFALSVLQDERNIDNTTIGAMGHSLGAIEAVLLAMRNNNVSAAIGLDGTYGFKGAAQVLTGFFSYAPRRMSAALLDLRKNEFQQQTVLDLSALNDFHFSDRQFITVDGMHHSDFTSFAVVGYQFHLPSTYTPQPGEHPWSRETAYHGYLNVCRIVKDFLDEKLKDETSANTILMADIKDASNGTFQRLPAADLPPSPDELLSLIRTKGFDEANTQIQQITQVLPVKWVVDEAVFNNLGYQLLNEKKSGDAISVFRINLSFHPTSANASDSLADGYLAAGDVPHAIEYYQQAIELLPKDPAFDAAGKASFSADEKSKIAKLR